MPVQTATELTSKLQSVQSIDDLCKLWQDIRPILVIIQGLLAFIYPAGAAAIQAIMTVLDRVCPTVNLSSASRAG